MEKIVKPTPNFTLYFMHALFVFVRIFLGLFGLLTRNFPQHWIFRRINGRNGQRCAKNVPVEGQAGSKRLRYYRKFESHQQIHQQRL
jgi:hypothetical protein